MSNPKAHNNSNNKNSDNRNNTKGITGVTPAGEAVFPKVIKPDTKFDPDGAYSLKLRIPDGPEADELIALIDSVREAAFEEAVENAPNAVAKKKVKMADPSYSRDLDRETGEDTGNWLFNFKMKASGVSKKTGKAWTRKPALFDSKGTPITNLTKNTDIWSGSVVKVAFELRPFYSPSFGAGCSHNLLAIQIIELVSGEGKTAEDFGFSEEEGGFATSAPDATLFDSPATGGRAAKEDEAEDSGDF